MELSWLECHRCVVTDGDDVVAGAKHCGVDARRAIVLGLRTRREIVGANWRSGDDGNISMRLKLLVSLFKHFCLKFVEYVRNSKMPVM